MPKCTVRYYVRLVPKVQDAVAMNAIAIFSEDRAPDELGEPGALLSRRLHDFAGPAGNSIRAMVTQGDAWRMDVQDRAGPLEWDG